jgi:hypothetical protein
MERKSRRRAKASAQRAAAGISIMPPIGISGSKGRPSLGQIATGLGEEAEGGFHLAQVGEHGEHEPHRSLGGGAQDGPELGAEQLGVLETEADGPQPQGRVAGGGTVGPQGAIHLFVGPQVEGADGDGDAPQAANGLTIGGQVFLFVRLARPVHVQELGTIKPDPSRPIGAGELGVVRQFQIGEEFHRLTITGLARLVDQAPQPVAPGAEGDQALPVVVEDVVIGPGEDGPASPSTTRVSPGRR